nr:MAG TPA: REPLICATION INITIATION PROTEIN [Inoviridae sp.]
MEILRLPAYDWLTFGILDDIYDGEALGLRVHEMDKGNGKRFWHEKSGFDDDGIYEYLVNDVPTDDISRIDICIDVRLESWEDIADYVPLVKKLKHKKKIESFGSGGGRTFYFGSNDLILRIYEKGNQLNKEETDYLKSWLRFEFQLKGRVARDYLRTTKDAEEIFSILAYRYLDIEFDQLELSNRKLVERDFVESTDYYKKQVLPWMKKEIKRNPDFYERLLNDLDNCFKDVLK